MPHSGQTRPAGGSTGCCVLALQAPPAPDTYSIIVTFDSGFHFLVVNFDSGFGVHLHSNVCAECDLYNYNACVQQISKMSFSCQVFLVSLWQLSTHSKMHQHHSCTFQKQQCMLSLAITSAPCRPREHMHFDAAPQGLACCNDAGVAITAKSACRTFTGHWLCHSATHLPKSIFGLCLMISSEVTLAW